MSRGLEPILVAAAFLAPTPIRGQERPSVPVVVDERGTMRWTGTGEEVEAAVRADGPRVGSIDGLQFAVGAAHFEDVSSDGAHGFEVERVILERRK